MVTKKEIKHSKASESALGIDIKITGIDLERS